MTAKTAPGASVHARPISDPGEGVPDASLVVAARGGSAWAKEALFRRHFRFASNFAFRLMGGDEDLSDVVQEAMAAALESLPSLRDPSLFSSWLGRVVINTVRHTLRRRRLLQRIGLRSKTPAQFDALISPSAPPDVAFELRVIYQALQRLPERPRIALVLRRVEAYSIPEIASQMSASTSSVKRWLDQADVQLAKELRHRTGTA